MKYVRTLLTLVIVLAMIAAGVLFSLQNTDPVPLDLLVYRFAPQSVSLWVLSALAVGGVLGIAASSLILWRLRSSLASTRRQLARARAELDRLHSPVTEKRVQRPAAAGGIALP
jgi:putative membrane protein